MSIKHTPGPWKFGKELTARSGEWLVSFDAGSKGRGIAIAETRAGSGSEEANARLIAASPTMYDYLVERAQSGDARAASIVEAINA